MTSLSSAEFDGVFLDKRLEGLGLHFFGFREWGILPAGFLSILLRLATEKQINQMLEDLSKHYLQHQVDQVYVDGNTPFLISKPGDIVAFLGSEFALSLGEEGHSILAFFLINWLSTVLIREGGVQDQGIETEAIHMAMDVVDEENSAFLAKRQKMPCCSKMAKNFCLKMGQNSNLWCKNGRGGNYESG